MTLCEILAEAKPLRGKTALVTGAARRVGRSIALALAEAGADVAITYRDSAEEAEKTVDELRARGSSAVAIPCDVRKEASIEVALTQLLDRYGRLDLLVNNAGIFESKPLDEIQIAEWDAVFETNTRGPFLMVRRAHQALKQSQGRVIHIGSLGGMHPWATHAHYCSSKAALHMMTQTMAKAFAPEISVNCIAPGVIVFGEPSAYEERLAKKTPMKRNGEGGEIAEAVLFFATGPHFITGQILAVDGGLGLT